MGWGGGRGREMGWGGGRGREMGWLKERRLGGHHFVHEKR